MPGIGMGIGIGMNQYMPGGSAPSPSWAQWMFATQWNIVNNIKEAQGRAGYISRYRHKTGAKPLKKLKFGIHHYHVGSSSTGLATSPGNDLPILDMSMEYNGVTYPVLFSGSRSGRILNGTNGWSDEIDIPATLGISELPVGSIFYTKFRVELDSSAHGIPAAAPRGTSLYAGQQIMFYDPFYVAMGSTDTPGVYTWTYQNSGSVSNTASRTSGMCPYVLGVHTDEPDIWNAFGDSMTANTGDTGPGWFVRALDAMPTPGAGWNFSVHGSTGRAGMDDSRILELYPYVNKAIGFKGANDFSTGGTSITAQAMLDRMLLWRTKALAANPNIDTFLICKTCPRTNSTNGWIDEVNQTPLPNWDNPAGFPLVYNDLLAGSAFDGVVPFDSIRGLVSVYNFLPNTAYDTTHINQAGNILQGAEASPIMQSFMFR